MVPKETPVETGNDELKVELNSSIDLFFKSLRIFGCKRIILKYFLLTCSFLGTSWLLLFVLDRFHETTQIYRFFILSAGILLSGWALWNSVLYGLIYSKQFTWLAKRVRDNYRGKGERLLGIVEIIKGVHSSTDSFSPQIFEAAQQKMAEEIEALKQDNIFPRQIIKRPLIGAIMAISIVLLIIVNFPALSINSFERWINPFASTKRITLTKFLESNVTTFNILQNEPNIIRFSLADNTRQNPNIVDLINRGEQPYHLLSKLNGGIYDFEIPPTTKTFPASLQAGDFIKKYKFNPISRPVIRSIIAKLTFPSYLHLDSESQKVMNKAIAIPEGTEVTILGKADRELSKIQIQDKDSQFSNQPHSKNFNIDLFKLKSNRIFNLHILDKYEFSAKEPSSIVINVQKDLPPKSQFSSLIDPSGILAFETRIIDFSSEDDFGLSQVSLDLKIQMNDKDIIKQRVLQKKFVQGGKKNSNLQFPFDPNIYNLEDGANVIFTATAKDHYPERSAVNSKQLKFKIIGSVAHAEMIRAKIDAILTEVSEIARNQEAIQSSTFLKSRKLWNSELTVLNHIQENDIRALQRKQIQLASQLKIVSKNGKTILQEASKNPSFDTQTLKDFASSFTDMESISSSPMRQSSRKLETKEINESLKTSETMMEAAEFQQTALDQLRKILSRFSAQIDKLEAKTLSQRLQEIERIEKKLSQKLVSLLPASIGRSPVQLSNKNLIFINEMGDKQKQASKDAQGIQNEISRYHERTLKSEYGKVSRLMGEANTQKKLSIVAESLRQNISFQSLDDLKRWEANFALWAEILQQESPGGDSPGGNAKGKDKTKDILSLLNTRKQQREIILKTKTVASDIFRGNITKWASSLKNQQDTLMIDLTDTQISVAEEALNPLFDDAHMAMSKSSEQLAKKGFGKLTLDAQNEAEELISDLINLLLEGQGKGQGKGNDNLTAMEMLMMQMKTKDEDEGKTKGQSPMAGSTGGGSTQTGSTDQVTDSLKRSSTNQIKTSSPSRTSVNGTPSVAPEYQKAMQKYFKAIED